MTKIYISSTFSDLTMHREAVYRALRRMRHDVVAMEHYCASHRRPVEKCLADVADCDLYVGIFARRYGYVPRENNLEARSITELEFRQAVKCRKPCLLFLLAEDHPWPEEALDGERLLRLREEMQQDYIVDYFRTPDHLASLVSTAVTNWEKEHAPAASGWQADSNSMRFSHLPIPPSPLVGRRTELDAAIGFLTKGVRLLTFTGPGGIGKTRLAQEVAWNLAESLPDGSHFVDLAPVSAPELVPTSIAEVIGLRQEPPRPLTETLKEAIAQKQILLLLDNFEQVMGSASLVAELLQSCPGLKMLVTSRERLRLRGEGELAVPPLDPPDLEHLPPPEELRNCPAVALFLERAQTAKANFDLTPGNARAVAEICCRLDGLPLAIELAAARIRIMPPDVILGRLSSRLNLLVGGARDLPERQKTLRDTIAWSYDLLEPEEQILFCRLSVFTGGFGLDEAERVCNYRGDLQLDSLSGLSSLIEKSLVRESESKGGSPRFTMLETIQEFGREELERFAETAATRDAHLACYMGLAEQADLELSKGASMVWIDRLEDEHENVRAALEWALEAAPGHALRLSAALYWFWAARHFLEDRELVAATLKLLDSGSNADVLSPGLRVRLKLLQSAFHLNSFSEQVKPGGDKDLALAAALEAETLAKAAGDGELVAEAVFAVSTTLNDQQRFSEAVERTQEALEIARRAKNALIEIGALAGLACIESASNAHFGDLGLLNRAAELARQLGDQRRELTLAYSKAVLCLRLERWSLLETALAEAESLNRSIQDPYQSAYTLLLRGECCAQCVSWGPVGDRGQIWQTGAEALLTAKALFERLGRRSGLCASMGWLGITRCYLGDMSEGISLLRQALTMERDLFGSREGAAKWLHHLGEVFVARSDVEQALQAFWHSEDLREELGHAELHKTRAAIERLRQQDPARHDGLRQEFDPQRGDFAAYTFPWGITLNSTVPEPVLNPGGGSWQSRATFNPAAWADDDAVHILYRACGPDGISRIGLATSTDGREFERRDSPVLEPTEAYESCGCEDPRLVRIGGLFYLTYTAYDGKIARLSMAVGTDLQNWRKLGPVIPNDEWDRLGPASDISRLKRGWSKSGALLPDRVNGLYWMYFGDTHVWVACSSDLQHWSVIERPVLSPREGRFDSGLVEPGPPPVLTEDGIWLGYNSADANLTYAFGQALFAVDDPTHLVRRSARPMVRASCNERMQDEEKEVIFPEGLVFFRGQWLLYCGIADEYTGLLRVRNFHGIAPKIV